MTNKEMLQKLEYARDYLNTSKSSCFYESNKSDADYLMRQVADEIKGRKPEITSKTKRIY